MSAAAAAGGGGAEVPPRQLAWLEEFIQLQESDPAAAARVANRALAAAGELVRVQRRARPVDHEQLAHALGQQATALFALERSEEADAVLEEQLAAWRRAYPPDDLRLALKLENYAEFVAKPFGRTATVVELLREAIAIREAFPEPARGGLAATLQKLAIHEIRSSSLDAAEQHLARAAELLAGEIARDPEREENRAGLAQICAMRASIAFAQERFEDAETHAVAAHEIRLRDPLFRAENELLLAMTRCKIAEFGGDLAIAIQQQERALEVFARNEELVANGSLDPAQRGDILLHIAQLQLAAGQPATARSYIEWAAAVLGETAEVLFTLSEFHRLLGEQALALSCYRRALRLRKESGTEMVVLFGTNRIVERRDELLVFTSGVLAAELSLGCAIVRVPGAQFSTTAWLAKQPAGAALVGRATNPEPLLFRPDTPAVDAAEFRSRARKAVGAARLYPDSALVFVHGYNVPFESALKRGAQLVRDLNYDSAAFVFSWPSLGLAPSYRRDRALAHDSAAALARFIQQVQLATGVGKIHLIAHSMGNRVGLRALVQLAKENSTLAARIGEVVLAAPAVPVPEFTTWMDELQAHGIERVTLYASSDDRALQLGYLAEAWTTLAGYVGRKGPALHPIVQSIDITASGGMNFLDHDVFASNPVMMEDIRHLLQTGLRPPHARAAHFKKAATASGEFWRYAAGV